MVEVVIKEVEGIKIYLREMIDSGGIDTIWVLMGLVIPSLSIYLIFRTVLSTISYSQIFVVIMTWILITIVSFLLIDILCAKSIPSYEVYDRENISSEIIHKINPEDDQIAICKAANRVGQKIIDRIQEEKNLEIIAYKCR